MELGILNSEMTFVSIQTAEKSINVLNISGPFFFVFCEKGLQTCAPLHFFLKMVSALHSMNLKPTRIVVKVGFKPVRNHVH